MIYFKHYSNMRHDLKLKRVISKYGLEGYGLYCLILESITESLSENNPIPDLQENCEDIAEFYNGNTAKINEMMSYMINQGLFDLEDDGAIICHQVYKILDTSQTRSEKLRNMIKLYKAKTSVLSETNHDKSDRRRIRKEEEIEEEEEEEEKEAKPLPPFKEIIDFLNESAKTEYRSSSKATQSHINARFAEGYTLDNFKTVITKKTNEWLGTDMAQYLRPSTLFGTKFESYLNQPEVKKEKVLDQYNMGGKVDGF